MSTARTRPLFHIQQRDFGWVSDPLLDEDVATTAAAVAGEASINAAGGVKRDVIDFRIVGGIGERHRGECSGEVGKFEDRHGARATE